MSNNKSHYTVTLRRVPGKLIQYLITMLKEGEIKEKRENKEGKREFTTFRFTSTHS